MLKLIQIIIFGHVHTYEIIEKSVLTNDSEERGTRIISRCSVCGKITSKDVI